MSWQTREVRNGQWITITYTPGTILSGDRPDDRSPEQMRLDALTQQVAYALAAEDDARQQAEAADSIVYPEHYARMQAQRERHLSILATVGTLLGDDAEYAMRETAYRLSVAIEDDPPPIPGAAMGFRANLPAAPIVCERADAAGRVVCGRLTTDRPESSYGSPVYVRDDGGEQIALGIAEVGPLTIRRALAQEPQVAPMLTAARGAGYAIEIAE